VPERSLRQGARQVVQNPVESLHRTAARTSDALGDWYLVLPLGLMRKILLGYDQEAADACYDDLKR
jgi:hypothetical protein